MKIELLSVAKPWNPDLKLKEPQEVEAPKFQMTHEGGKVVNLRHRPPLPLGNIPGTYLCYRLSRPKSHSAAGRILSKKISNYTTGN